jgi:CDP-glucose 4,6-dehydratase
MARNLISKLQENGSSILITGHTGFKGTWMTLLLEKLGIEVFGYSLEPTESSLYNRLSRADKIVEIFEDIRNEKALNDFIFQVKPTFVIHMAAQPLVLESYKKPKETFDVNVLGTANVLNASLAVDSVKVVGVITTDKVYRNNNIGRKFIETDPLEGFDPYSASKVATESVINAWRSIYSQQNNKKIVSLRSGNVIGGGDFAENRIMPDLVRGMMSGETVKIRNTMSTRPWQHVLDPLYGYLLGIAYSDSKPEFPSSAYNFGPSESSYSVGALLEVIENEFPGLIRYAIDENSTDFPYESKLLDLDSNLAREELGWEPVWSQESAITSTIKWWKKVLEKNCTPTAAMENDIRKFLLTRGFKDE